MARTIKVKFIIAIDAGGSKILGRIICIATQQKWNIKSGSASLSHNLQLSSERIKNIAEALMLKANAASNESVIVCGVAGAGCENNRQYLNDYLGEKYNHKLIITDAKTSLYGAGLGEAILVIAIGTGSVAMRLDVDGNEIMCGGWGFVAGDLGSGADIGRQLIRAVLVEFDKQSATPGNTQDALILDVLQTIGLERQSILDWLKGATAKDYANLAPLIFEYRASNQLAISIIKNAAYSIEQLIKNSQPRNTLLPVALVGGLANKIRQYLSSEIQSRIIDAKGDALDGAIYLAEKLIETNANSANPENNKSYG